MQYVLAEMGITEKYQCIVMWEVNGISEKCAGYAVFPNLDLLSHNQAI